MMNFMRRTNLCFKRVAAVFLCVAGILTLTACGSVNREQRQVVAMDTVMTLTAYGKNASAGLDAAASVIHSMNGELDPELPTSTTYAINHANGSAVVVNAQTAKMLSTAKTVYDQSDGALDLSIYPVVKIWGFTNRRYYVPTYEELAMKLAQRAYDKMVLTSYPATGSYSVIFPAGTEISFGGKWTVAIQDPNNTANWVGTVNVGETAVVTSGGYQRFFEFDGNVYHHIINPQSGNPVSNSLLSVTIICEDGTMADALSTAMFVLGESRALNYWRQYGGFEMIMINKSNQIICTKGLIDTFKQNDAAPDYKVRYSE